jgi:hypothetical protein
MGWGGRMLNKITRNIILVILIVNLSSCVTLFLWNKHMNQRVAAYENKEDLAGCTKDAILSRFGKPEKEIISDANGSACDTYFYKLHSNRQIHITIREGIVRSYYYN